MVAKKVKQKDEVSNKQKSIVLCSKPLKVYIA